MIWFESARRESLINLTSFDEIGLHVIDSDDGIGEDWHVDGMFFDERKSIPIFHPNINGNLGSELALAECRAFMKYLKRKIRSGAASISVSQYVDETM